MIKGNLNKGLVTAISLSDSSISAQGHKITAGTVTIDNLKTIESVFHDYKQGENCIPISEVKVGDRIGIGRAQDSLYDGKILYIIYKVKIKKE